MRSVAALVAVFTHNISCETSMAACETNPFLLCDVLPSAVASSGRRALHAFGDAFDGEPALQRHPLRQLKESRRFFFQRAYDWQSGHHTRWGPWAGR